MLVGPAVPPGALCGLTQPCLDLGVGLVARPWRPVDVAFLERAFQDRDIQRWHARRLDGADEARAWLAQWPQRWDAETAASWAIAAADTDGAVGQVGLRAIQLDAGRAQISYWVAPEARGRGAAASAAAGVTAWAMSVVGLQRVGLTHAVANSASCRVAARARFTYEGTLRSYGLHADGWHDMHLHARLADDQPAAMHETATATDGFSG